MTSPSHFRVSRRVIGLAGALVFLAAAMNGSAENWPSWRGPNGDGSTPEQVFPTTWSATENIRWKMPLPDRGNSSPIVWDGKVFVTQAIDEDKRRTVMCFDRRNGKLLWQQGTVFPKEEVTHRTNPYCSASPVTDGERVIATFGSAGVFCYDMRGTELWRRDLGPQEHIWGNASSPVIFGDICILYHGPGDYGHLIALDKRTGQTVWKLQDQPVATAGRTDGFRGNEPGVVGSFATPMLVRADGRDQLVMMYPNRLAGFDPATGHRRWWCDGLNPLIYTSPIWDGETLVAMGGYHGDALAVRPVGTGDITATRLWHRSRVGSSVGSGVIHDGHVYYHNNGIGYCLELATGKEVWEERLKGDAANSGSWSSMTLSGDRIYLVNQSAETFILRASPRFELIAVNGLNGELTNGTQAMSNGELFIRTHEHLWCVGDTKGLSLNSNPITDIQPAGRPGARSYARQIRFEENRLRP